MKCYAFQMEYVKYGTSHLACCSVPYIFMGKAHMYEQIIVAYVHFLIKIRRQDQHKIAQIISYSDSESIPSHWIWQLLFGWLITGLFTGLHRCDKCFLIYYLVRCNISIIWMLNGHQLTLWLGLSKLLEQSVEMSLRATADLSRLFPCPSSVNHAN